ELDNSASGGSRPAPSRATNSFQRAVEWLRTPPLRHLPPVPAPVTPRGTSATTQAPPQIVHNQRLAAGQTQFRPQAGPGWNGNGYAPGWNGSGYAPGWNGSGYAPGRNGNGHAPGWNRNGYAPTMNGPRPTPMPPRAAAPRAAAPPALRPVPHNNPGGLSRVDTVRPWVSNWWRPALVDLLGVRGRHESAENALREAESNLAVVEQAHERNGDAPSQVQQQLARLRRAVESARARVRLEQAALQHAEQRVRGIDPLAWQQVQLFADSWQSEAWATFAEDVSFTLQDVILPSLPPGARAAVDQQVGAVFEQLRHRAPRRIDDATLHVVAEFLLVQKAIVGPDNQQGMHNVATAVAEILHLNSPPSVEFVGPRSSFESWVAEAVIGMDRMRVAPGAPGLRQPMQSRYVVLMQQAAQIMRNTRHDIPFRLNQDPDELSAEQIAHDTLLDQIQTVLAWQMHIDAEMPQDATRVPESVQHRAVLTSTRL